MSPTNHTSRTVIPAGSGYPAASAAVAKATTPRVFPSTSASRTTPVSPPAPLREMPALTAPKAKSTTKSTKFFRSCSKSCRGEWCASGSPPNSHVMSFSISSGMNGTTNTRARAGCRLAYSSPTHVHGPARSTYACHLVHLYRRRPYAASMPRAMRASHLGSKGWGRRGGEHEAAWGEAAKQGGAFFGGPERWSTEELSGHEVRRGNGRRRPEDGARHPPRHSAARDRRPATTPPPPQTTNLPSPGPRKSTR
jgi:hypothetical protein